LNLIGDGIHNFIDGLIIGASFVMGIKIGIISTFAIIMHEIPQELGDFGVFTLWWLYQIQGIILLIFFPPQRQS